MGRGGTPPAAGHSEAGQPASAPPSPRMGACPPHAWAHLACTVSTGSQSLYRTASSVPWWPPGSARAGPGTRVSDAAQLEQGRGGHLRPCAQASRKRMWPLTSRLQSWPSGKVNISSQGAAGCYLPCLSNLHRVSSQGVRLGRQQLATDIAGWPARTAIVAVALLLSSLLEAHP